MQEAARRRVDFDQAVGLAGDHLKPVKGAQRRGRLALNRADGGEIMPADKPLRSLVHGLDVKRFG